MFNFLPDMSVKNSEKFKSIPWTCEFRSLDLTVLYTTVTLYDSNNYACLRRLSI